MHVSLHYFAGNIDCVNIVVLVDQVLTGGRGTYHEVKSAVPPPSQNLFSCTLTQEQRWNE